MPPTLGDRLTYILTAIGTIESALANKRAVDLAGDLMLRLAVERAFEIICEASRRIPDDVKLQQPQIDWKGMADFGNLLCHVYHRVEPNLLWLIAERDLPPLKTFVEHIIREGKP